VFRYLRRAAALALQPLIVSGPWPLKTKARAISTLLPVGIWHKSLAYQQCLANDIIKAYGSRSQSGLFKGMACLQDADEGCLVPKLLGCYEEELTAAIEDMSKEGYDRVIDVGCASGYWLTGLALRMPGADAFGFDINDRALKRCSEMLRINGVQSRVKLANRCTPDDFEKLIKDRTIVFMDIDGPEFELLDPKLSPALLRASIIVECHDYLNPKIIPTLLERFRSSHSIQRVASRIRQPSLEAYPGLKALPQEHWSAALDERRPAIQEWLIMRCNAWSSSKQAGSN
jgi:hypothetical protein